MRTAICFFLIVGSMYAQQDASEKLVKPSIINTFSLAMALTEPSIDQVDSILEQSYRYLFNNQDTCLILAERAIEHTTRLYSEESIHAQALLQLGDAHRIRDEKEEAEQLYFEGRKLYKELKMDGKIANADTKLGALQMELGNFEAAINYHLNALEIWETLKDSGNLFKPYVNITEVFYLLGRKDKAHEYNATALRIAVLRDHIGQKMIALSNQGTLEKELGDEYVEKADSSGTQGQLFRDSSRYFYENALISFGESLKIAQNGNNKRRTTYFLSNIAEVKTALGRYREAIELSQEAGKIASELGSTASIVRSKVMMAYALNKLGSTPKAISEAKLALDLAVSNRMSVEKSKLDEILYHAYKSQGRYSDALLHYEEFSQYQSELDNSEKNEVIAEVEEKYQSTQKEKQILEQKNDILELETANSKVTTQRNYLLGGSFAIGLLGFLGFQWNKARKERNDKIAFAKALIYAQEEERKRIARDLHDGVGQSLLLIKKQMETTTTVTKENQKLISSTLDEVRAISQDLHPFQLEKFGLTSAIVESLYKVEQSTDLFVTSEIENIDQLLSEHSEINLYRTIQEALSNIIKHAEATAIKLNIKKVPSGLKVVVLDNGRGFDYEWAIVKSKSLGLKTMFERISSIGGKFNIQKVSPKGTAVEIILPLFEAQPN